MNQPIYYYIRDRGNHPIITVCLLKNNEDISRGTAVCSKQESPNKQYGKALAFKRAKKAMKARKNLFMVVRDEILFTLDGFLVPETFYEWKGFFNPSLSLWEVNLITRNEKE